MKKILIVVTCFVLSLSVSRAQDDELKQFQFGFSTGFAMKFLDANFTNYLDRPGMGAGFSGGLVLNYHFNDRFALSTGLLFDLESFRTTYSVNEDETGPFYGYKDKDILRSDELDNIDGLFFLEERKNSLNYLSIPLKIRLQTNKIGFLRYYGTFGIKADLLVQQRVDDEGKVVTQYTSTDDISSFEIAGASSTLERMNNTGHYGLLRSAVSFSAGAEWFFSGNTALFAELEFNYGIMSNYRGRSRTVYYFDSEDEFQDLQVKANMHQFLIKVGITF